MAEIKVKVDQEKSLTNVTVYGEWSGEEFVQFSTALNENITKNVLFDLSQGTIAKIDIEVFMQELDVAAQSDVRRAGGKTAVVTAKDVDYGLARLYQTHSEIRYRPIEFRVFRNMPEAVQWLES